MESNILGGVGVGNIILMFHIPEVQGPPSLPSVLLATPGLGTGKDVQARGGGAAEVHSDVDDGARVVYLDLFDHAAVVRSRQPWRLPDLPQL